MDYETISNKIYYCLREKENHIINLNITYNYFNKFWECVKLLFDCGLLKSQNDLDKFCTKLQMNKEYKIDKYYQGISEIVFWIYFCSKGYELKVDRKLRKDNNTDVDLQIKEEQYLFNIEIKCPQFIDKINENNILNLNIPFRSVDKVKLEEIMKELKSDILKPILANSQGRYQKFETTKINDNKVIEYLKSCQNKFANSDDMRINILVISVQSSEMQDYWGYLYNKSSGIFTKGFKDKFKDKNGNIIKQSDFNKVDVIYLTNAVSGHISINDMYDSWDLNTYFNLLCMNPFSLKKIRKDNKIIYEKLMQLLPNDNIEFEKKLEKKQIESQNLKLPLDATFVSDYLYDNYKLLL